MNTLERYGAYSSCYDGEIHHITMHKRKLIDFCEDTIGWSKSDVSAHRAGCRIPGYDAGNVTSCRKEVFLEFAHHCIEISKKYQTKKVKKEKIVPILDEFRKRRFKKYGMFGE